MQQTDYCKFLSRNPREIKLYQGDSSIQMGDLFRVLYGAHDEFNGLDNAIQYNKDIALGKKEPFKVQMGVGEKTEMWPPYLRNEVRQWLEHIEDNGKLTAKVTFDNGETIVYNVEPRTNFESEMIQKYPNIARLRGEDGTKAVIRESRHYNPETDTAHNLAGRNIQQYDDESSRYLHTQDLNQKSKLAKGEGVVLLPEPNLVLTLEALYAKHRSDGQIEVPRITPKIKVVGAEEDKLWYVRDWLPQCVDTTFESKSMGRYQGMLAALGISEILDRDIEEYAEQVARGKVEVVNYDPDLFTMNGGSALSVNMNGLKNEVEITKTMALESRLKRVREEAETTAEKLEKMGITPDAFEKEYTSFADMQEKNLDGILIQ